MHFTWFHLLILFPCVAAWLRRKLPFVALVTRQGSRGRGAHSKGRERTTKGAGDT
jgi:hypothetical protein